MSLFKKHNDPATETEKNLVHEENGMEHDIQADVDAVMKKYDRESNTRVWEGGPKIALRVLMSAFSVYCILMTLFSKALPERRLSLFLGFIIIIGYLVYPARKGAARVNHVPWYDWILMALGAGSFFYFAINAFSIIQLATKLQPIHIIIGTIGILVLIELCRRCVGLPILCVLGVLLIYTFYNQLSWDPSFYKALKNIVYKLFYTTSGVIGTPVSVCYTYIVLFIIFGAFLERTGIANFFISFANRLAGWSSGGPAKVAVISSALCGMVSGSSVGNTVTTGSVTIPMMKKTGYQPQFAGAVEAASSTGGQIMPPIMGATAFLMAEYMGIPYAQVALKAILPAVLYFTGIYIAVHLEAKRLGLRGLSKEELPKIKNLLPKLYLLLPLIILVVMVSTNMYTMQFSASVAIGITILVGLVNKDDRITLTKCLDALEAGGKGTITVAVACAMAGLVAGCITSTGLASKLITVIVNVSGGHAIIALALTMLCCIVLGMGVPTTANYCIMAATCAPILMSPQIGIPRVCAHFFVFYFGIVADITPPVALAAYAGSAIAKAPPMKTAFNATRLAIAAFIVPYIFAFSPVMLFEFEAGTSTAMMVLQVIQICITSLLGIFGVAAALNGFLFRQMNPLFRVLMALGGLGMMIPGTVSDLVGLVVVGGIYAYQYVSVAKKKVLG